MQECCPGSNSQKVEDSVKKKQHKSVFCQSCPSPYCPVPVFSNVLTENSTSCNPTITGQQLKCDHVFQSQDVNLIRRKSAASSQSLSFEQQQPCSLRLQSDSSQTDKNQIFSITGSSIRGKNSGDNTAINDITSDGLQKLTQECSSAVHNEDGQEPYMCSLVPLVSCGGNKERLSDSPTSKSHLMSPSPYSQYIVVDIPLQMSMGSPYSSSCLILIDP